MAHQLAIASFFMLMKAGLVLPDSYINTNTYNIVIPSLQAGTKHSGLVLYMEVQDSNISNSTCDFSFL